MNHTRWKGLLEQTGPKDYVYLVKKSPSEVNIEILDNATSSPVEGKPNQYGEPTNSAHMKLIKRGEEGNWEVASVASPRNSAGVGKEVYLLALELTSTSGLSPDSVDISSFAHNIWMKYLKNHPLVSFVEKQAEVDASEDDPFKYIWTIDPSYSSPLDIKYEKVEDLRDIDDSYEELEPFEPLSTDLDDYLEDIDENQAPDDTNEVAKVIIYDKNGQILILKRVDKPHNWDIPGGHLKKGENLKDGAIRETFEETNLNISSPKFVNSHNNIHFFKCECPKGEISLDSGEHLDFKWINPRALSQYSLWNDTKDAIFKAVQVVHEDYQRNIKKNHSKLKFRLIGLGKNTYNVGGKMKKPSYKRSKSAPGDFGGA